MAKPEKSRKPLTAKTPELSNTWLGGIAVITLAFLHPVLKKGFINFDVPQYVLNNPLIQSLSGENIKAMFSGQILGNYQPLVLISYALQFKFFGAESATGYHAFSLLLHIVNTILVSKIALRLLKNVWPAVLVGLLFGIHPLHVESVAWVAAQKDMLFVLFFLLGLQAYLKFSETGNGNQHLLVYLFFILSLLSKAQAVVFPVVLLLMDWFNRGRLVQKDFISKLPLFVISVLMGLLAIKMQKEAGAVQDAVFTFGQRLLFASYGFVMYLWQTLVPVKLSIFYPYPETDLKINSNLVYLAPLIVMACLGLVFYLRKFRFVVFGFLFFCVNIALLLQVIPVGDAIHADRYTYLSLVGLFFIAGGVLDLKLRNNPGNKNLLVAPAILLLVFGALAYRYSLKWIDSVSIYSHALSNYEAPIVYSNRGAEYYKLGKLAEAADDFSKAISIKPQFPNAYKNRALTYEAMGNHEQALADFGEAIKYKPGDFELYFTRGNILKNMNRLEEAKQDYRKVIEINSGVLDAWMALAECDFRTGNYTAALEGLNKVLDMKPDYGNAYFNRSITLRQVGKINEAIQDAESARKFGHPVEDGYISELNAMLK